MSIYGPYEQILSNILSLTTDRIKELNRQTVQDKQPKLYEHLIARVKTSESMAEKCQRKGYPVSTESALRKCRDAVGIRIICNFINDIDRCLCQLRQADWCEVIKEKDYITNAKPNGYRSYHVIIDEKVPYQDIEGNNPGHFYVEIQLRTIAMDFWASLEHELHYKNDADVPDSIRRELFRVAETIAMTDREMEEIALELQALD